MSEQGSMSEFAGTISKVKDFYLFIMWEQVRNIMRFNTDDKAKFIEGVNGLSDYLVSFLDNENGFKTTINDIYKKRIENLNIYPKKNRDDDLFLISYNADTARMIFKQLLLLISKCGFMPEQHVSLVLE